MVNKKIYLLIGLVIIFAAVGITVSMFYARDYSAKNIQEAINKIASE